MKSLFKLKPFEIIYFPVAPCNQGKPETITFVYYHLKGFEWDFHVDICDPNGIFLKRLAYVNDPKTEIDQHIQRVPKGFIFRNNWPFLLIETYLRKALKKLKFQQRTYDFDGFELKEDYKIRIINRTASIKFLKAPILNVPNPAPTVDLRFPKNDTFFYFNHSSAFPGSEIELRISGPTPALAGSLVNVVAPSDTLLKFEVQNVVEQEMTPYMFKLGCNWKASHILKLPENLPSGLYAIGLNDGQKTINCPLVVKSHLKSKILVVAATNTWQAYNYWGGGSIYDYFIKDGSRRERSHMVSFDRPNPEADPFKPTRSVNLDGQLLANAEVPLYKWLTKQKFTYNVISDEDLHNQGKVPDGTSLVILSNHSEYWTAPMYDALETHLKGGGHLLNLSGNAIYWKVVIKDNQMEVRKNHSMHTLIHEPGGNWASLGRPESSILGGSYTLKGWHTYAPYKILDQKHWLLEGTALKNGDLIGDGGKHFGPASGWECDKRDAYSPPNVEIIAKGTNPKNGGAEWMIHQRPEGGWVMTTSSISFNGALEDTIISKILLNYFKKIMLSPF